MKVVLINSLIFISLAASCSAPEPGVKPPDMTGEEPIAAEAKTTWKDATKKSGRSHHFDSDHLQLSVTHVGERTLPVKVLVRSLASQFNLGHLWQAPRICQNLPTNHQSCSNSAEQVYCNDVLNGLNQLYCQLGGESRTTSSYLGHRLTSGDLVVLWRFATQVCSLRRAPNPNQPQNRVNESAVAERLGIAVNQEKGGIAAQLLLRFLGIGPQDSAWDGEKRFVLHTLLQAELPDEVYPDSSLGKSQLWEQFSAACTYLTVHRHQVVY